MREQEQFTQFQKVSSQEEHTIRLTRQSPSGFGTYRQMASPALSRYRGLRCLMLRQ